MSLFIGTRAPFRSLEKRLRLAQFVSLFLGPAPITTLGLRDDLLEILVAFVGELARGMAILDPLDVLVQLFLVLERDGRQKGLELAAILELANRRLAAAGKQQHEPHKQGRSRFVAARLEPIRRSRLRFSRCEPTTHRSVLRDRFPLPHRRDEWPWVPPAIASLGVGQSFSSL